MRIGSNWARDGWRASSRPSTPVEEVVALLPREGAHVLDDREYGPGCRLDSGGHPGGDSSDALPE